MTQISPAIAAIVLEEGDRFALLAGGEERTGTVAGRTDTGCLRFTDDATGRTVLADLAHWDAVRLDSTRLARRPDIRPHWLRDEIAADPGLLGLGALRHAPLSPRGIHSLILDDPATGIRYAVDVQHGSCDEDQLARSSAAAHAEQLRSPHTTVVPVVVAERIPAHVRARVELGIEARATDVGRGISLELVPVPKDCPEPFAGLIGAA
jgi:hypothetical protein